VSKRIAIIPDSQIPYHNRKALKAVIKFVGDVQPDEVIHIGDILDLPQPSRWNKGTAGEFEGSVFEDSEAAKRFLMEPLRAVYDGPVKMHEGNHDERARTYLAKYAPALAGSGAFNVETLLDFDGFGVELLPTFYKIAPGWITTHGHMGQISLSPIAGNTALRAADKFDTSVVMGHTHRQGILSKTKGFGGDVKTQLTGMEVGHLMDQKLAAYLKQGTGNWQLGFGLLTIDGQHVKPEVVPIHRGRFTVDGHTWEV
jgi:predicted phosphodiesterase